MSTEPELPRGTPVSLREAVPLTLDKVFYRQPVCRSRPFRADEPALILLAAGKGTRFGQEPKCAQLVNGVPLARHSIQAFQAFSAGPVLCVVGYRSEQVAAALGDDNLYIRSTNPAGGTAYAVYEAFSLAELERTNPVVIITMGDRIVPTTIFRQLYDAHLGQGHEAALTFLTALYEPPRNQGKGRILRDAGHRVLGIVEQKDIDVLADEKLRQSLNALTEGNCPLYAIRARTLRGLLEPLSNQNSQRQYYLTDIIEAVRRTGGEIRTICTSLADPEYDLLCSDVTRPTDLALLEGILKTSSAAPGGGTPEIERAASTLQADRPPGQVSSLVSQLAELYDAALKLGFRPDHPVSIGLAGGRLRIAFMHPDMGRFFGPAWQMPIGAADARGREQILVLLQTSEDHRIHLTPMQPEFREKIASIPADIDCMYPTADVADWYSYEGFGTRMAEQLLLSLGYFTDQELQRRKEQDLPLPPASLWIRNSMRRPFSLVGNAIASMRTVRTGRLGAKIQRLLGRENFAGLRIIMSGDIPRGGFSSSSAVTVATKNAINALYDLGVPPDLLVHLSCQAEYGTGVRAGSLDQATEQKGRAGEGTLISSNPRDNYRILGTYPVPAHRFQVLFPYSVDRDCAAWRWSAGCYAAEPGPGRQTTIEMRKMTGKAAELAALLVRLPLDQDFFKRLEPDLVRNGTLSVENRRWIGEVLRQVPLLIGQSELRERIEANRAWHTEQLADLEKLDPKAAAEKTEATLTTLFAGWREPTLRRTTRAGDRVQEEGVPLRAMVAYLFGEVAKNFFLIHHPEEWITWVSRSQFGDRCFDIPPAALPKPASLRNELPWEKACTGPARLDRWLERIEAQPFDFNRGIDDEALHPSAPPEFHRLEGSNFFRGLALIDLAEAMLKRAFGSDAIAVRVNAAGQGDFFQVHVDLMKASLEEVKDFIRAAFYRRFDLHPEQEFVEPHSGGGAVGVRLARFDQLPHLLRGLGAVIRGK